jgi:hypothetical protein
VQLIKFGGYKTVFVPNPPLLLAANRFAFDFLVLLTLSEIRKINNKFYLKNVKNGICHVQVISATGQVDFNFSIGLM